MAKPSDDQIETRHDRTETWLSQVTIGQRPGMIGQSLAEPSDDRTEPRHDRIETLARTPCRRTQIRRDLQTLAAEELRSKLLEGKAET
jgi:hypothetical protein